MVILRLAACGLFRDRCMLATTLDPMPNISPTPPEMRNRGATMLTAAKASLLTPCPTNAPSVMLSTTIETMPMSVGKNMRPNTRLTGSWAKSIASLLSLIWEIC